jgi:hypothetical protein
MTDDNTADLFYGGDHSVRSGYEPAIADDLNRISDVKAWSQAERLHHATELSHAFRDAGLTSGEASVLLGHVATATKAPPDEATVNGWKVQTNNVLREQYGLEEGDRRYAVAIEYVSKRPVLNELLTATNTHVNPAVVRMLAEKVGTPGSPYGLRVNPRKRA